jgi:hypothetical protein
VTVLLAAGVGLLLFGGLVLLRFPDRPGGKIGWQGFEVSSVGAGMPLIVVGVAAIAFAGLHGSDNTSAGEAASTTSTGAAAACFRGATRLKKIEAGASAVEVIRSDQPKTEPVWLEFTDGGTPLGGLRFRYIPDNALFKVERVVDASCAPIEPVENVARGGDPHTLQNWDTLRLRFGDRLYDMRIGAASNVEVNFSAVS